MSGYGEAPVDLGEFDLTGEFTEFMHYLYLPVRIPEDYAHGSSTRRTRKPTVEIPERLDFLGPLVYRARDDAMEFEHLSDPYIYVTARRGFATPGNPLNRPGWHCDDFGGSDLNYVWSDRWPTRVLRSDADLRIVNDDAASMMQMGGIASAAAHLPNAVYSRDGSPPTRVWIEDDAPVNRLVRLTPQVIHDTPIIPEGGGMRSFIKVSVSPHRYNLIGNSRNYMLNYDWPMFDREAVRNQPDGNSDYVKEA